MSRPFVIVSLRESAILKMGDYLLRQCLGAGQVVHPAKCTRRTRADDITADLCMLCTSLRLLFSHMNFSASTSTSSESTQPKFPTTSGTILTRNPTCWRAKSVFNPRYFNRFSSVRSVIRDCNLDHVQRLLAVVPHQQIWSACCHWGNCRA